MLHTSASAKKPLAITGILGLLLALLAVGLALYGVTPYPRTLVFPRQPLPSESATLIHAGTIVGPILLGLFAMALGQYTMGVVERSLGKKTGEGPAVFALFLGLLAVVLACVSGYVVFVHGRFN